MPRLKPLELYRGSSKPHAPYSYVPEGEYFARKTLQRHRRVLRQIRRQQQLAQYVNLLRSWGTQAWLWVCAVARQLFSRLAGYANYQERTLETAETRLWLREGDYPCLIRVYETQIKKQRWPWPYTCYRTNIYFTELPVPYPVENQWVDGQITSLTVEAKTVEEACGQALSHVLKARREFGGAAWLPKVLPNEVRNLKRK